MKRLLFLCVMILALFAAVYFAALENNKPVVLAPVAKNTSGIEVFSPKPGELIRSPLKITGAVHGSGWAGFEGTVGTVTLQDSKGNPITTTYLKATTEWTQLPTDFEANVEFKAIADTTGFLVFHNENPSGQASRDKTITIPIQFK